MNVFVPFGVWSSLSTWLHYNITDTRCRWKKETDKGKINWQAKQALCEKNKWRFLWEALAFTFKRLKKNALHCLFLFSETSSFSFQFLNINVGHLLSNNFYRFVLSTLTKAFLIAPQNTLESIFFLF